MFMVIVEYVIIYFLVKKMIGISSIDVFDFVYVVLNVKILYFLIIIIIVMLFKLFIIVYLMGKICSLFEDLFVNNEILFFLY